MGTFYVVKEKKAAQFLVESTSFEGVRMIADTVAEDIEAVSDQRPEIQNDLSGCTAQRVILMATIGKSALLDRLESEGKLSLAPIRGKREVYLMQQIAEPFAEASAVKELLVIAGSDKRGTIYGMFRLSDRKSVV